MEDFLKFLLIAGVILVGIFKEVNKNSKSKKAKNKRPVSPMPSPVEVAPDAVPMPEAWGRPKSLEELFQPNPRETDRHRNSLPNRRRNQQRSRKEKKKKYPFPHPWQTVPRKINEIPNKVLIITLTPNQLITNMISRFTPQKKPAALLSGERYFNGSIDREPVELIEFRIIM